jgi:phospholipid transport system transporter-binding protein
MAQITNIDNVWEISGDVQFGTAKTLLDASSQLPIAANTLVDFKAVTDIDTAAISLILEWKRRAQKENKSLQFVNLSANLTSLTELYGVAELIN